LADRSHPTQAVTDEAHCEGREGEMESQARLRRVLELLLEVDLERMGALFEQEVWQEKSENST